MTDAVISGRAGVALLLEEDSLSSFDVNDPSKLVPRQQADLHFLFGETRDLQILEDTTHEEIAQTLDRAYNCSCALDFALISLDSELSDETRTEAADALEELLADTYISDYLEAIFYARPLPASADMAGALKYSEATRAIKLHTFFSILNQSQRAIREVLRAWELIPIKIFGSREERSLFEQTAIREELFYELVLVCMGEEKADNFLLHSLLNPSIHSRHNYRDVLQQWVSSFRTPSARKPPYPKAEEQPEAAPLQLRGRKPRRRSFDRAAVLEKVERQKQVIVEELRNYNLVRAHKFIDELISYQLENGEPKFAAMSLCDLAMEAKNLGFYPIQLALTEQSIAISPTDNWAWAQYGDALLNMQRLDDALEAYEQADAFGAGVIAKKGRGEVFKTQGKLDDALAAYNGVIAEHPEDVFAKNGRAEVLKAQGKLDDALAAYDEIIAEHPEDVVAKTGRAEVLKAQGRFDDALAAYNGVIAEHPEDVFAKNGRAEVLKAQGKLDDALAAYDEVIAEHPENVVARNGRAEVLKAQGKLDDALIAFNKVIAEHPENVVAKTGRAEVLKAQGKLDDALAAYDEIIAEHPENVVARNGRAEVLKAQGKLDDALAAYDEIIAEHPENVVAKTGRAEVSKAQGRFDDALAAYDEIIAEHPENVVAKTGRAEVFKAQGKLDDALIAFNKVIAEHPEDVVAKTGRAEVFKTQGKLDDALIAFNKVIAEHPENVVARNGRAEVLKAQGKLDDALAAYDEIIAEHPENVVARNGRAEVLKAQGKLDDALAAYDEIIAEHPENVVAKTGRAEVSKTQGKLDDALAAYDVTLIEHPEDDVVKRGRAEVLKAMGRLDKALAAYDGIILVNSNDVIAKSGRSCVLAGLGRYDEALESLPDKYPVTLQDWIGYHIRGMILLRTGKVIEAIRIFNEGAQNNPWSFSKEYFHNALAIAWLRRGDFKEAGKILDKVKSPLLQARANVFRIHAFGAEGNLQRATVAYDSLATEPRFQSNELTQELRRQFILREPPRYDKDWILDREVKIELLAA